MLNRSVPPPSFSVDYVDLLEAQAFLLDNGVKGHYLSAGDLPVMRLELVIKAGKRYEAFPGVSFFAGKMLLEGTATRSSRNISDFFDGLGAFIEVVPGYDFITITIHHLKKHLETMLPVIAELLYQPLYGNDELSNLKRIKHQKLQVNLQRNNFVASRKFRELLFGRQHPYGRNLEFENIEKLQREDILDHWRKYMEGQYEIIVSGQVSTRELALINRYLGPLKVAETIETKIPLGVFTPQEVLIEKEDSLQSTIRMGMPTIDRKHKDYFKVLVANEILGGYFGSRLMRNLREDKGYTYGIHSVISHLLHGTMFIIGTEVKKDFRAQTIYEIRQEIKAMQRQLLDKEELRTVTSYMAGKFASEVDSAFALADKFKTIYFNGLGYDYYKEYYRNLKEIDNTTILEISRKYFPLEKMGQVVVG